MTNFFYYFAYGSNLLKDRIRVQIKGAEYECNGVLNDFKLSFVHNSERWRGALATIKESGGSEMLFQVWGCVWRVPHEFALELDKQEIGYHRLEAITAIEDNGYKGRVEVDIDAIKHLNSV
uniref:gamma-glutamylcyclotransferase n=1 Tax=Heterorhabditis bacteriophora TaxID=37862 RepID=A0A1I7WW83_HETBA